MIQSFPVYTKTRNRASWVKKLGSYFSWPALQIENTWRGASEIILVFHFWPDFNPSILDFSKPEDAEYCAVISWIDNDGNKVRYKLWEHVGEFLYAPLYSGQRILPHFTIEIWNTNKTPLITIPAQLIYLSKLIAPSTKCDTADVELNLYRTQCTDIIFDFSNFNPSAGDYFIVSDAAIGICPTATLNHLVALDNLLIQSNDGTWHKFYLVRLQDPVDLSFFTDAFVDPVNQPAPAPGTLPYFPLFNATLGESRKLNCVNIAGDQLPVTNEVAPILGSTGILLIAPQDGLKYLLSLSNDGDMQIGQVGVI